MRIVANHIKFAGSLLALILTATFAPLSTISRAEVPNLGCVETISLELKNNPLAKILEPYTLWNENLIVEVKPYLESNSKDISNAALTIISNSKVPLAADVLREYADKYFDSILQNLNSSSVNAQCHAAYSMTWLAAVAKDNEKKEIVPRLIALLKSKDKNVAMVSSTALSMHKEESPLVIKQISANINETDSIYRKISYACDLVRIGGDEREKIALPVFLSALKNTEIIIREKAMSCFFYTGSKQLYTSLLSTLKQILTVEWEQNKTPIIKQSALHMLKIIDTPEAKELLQKIRAE
jgi:HEAT repeat protein